MFILLGRLDLKRRFTDWPKQLIKQNISSLKLQLVKSWKLLPYSTKVITSQIEIPEHLPRLQYTTATNLIVLYKVQYLGMLKQIGSFLYLKKKQEQ